MKEGDVVVVGTKLDNRINETKAEEAIGTIILLTSTVAWVLLMNGLIWTGTPKLLYPPQV